MDAEIGMEDYVPPKFIVHDDKNKSVSTFTGAFETFQRSKRQWARFLHRCRIKRLDFKNFERFVKLQQAKHHLPAHTIADIFLKPLPKHRDYLDPRFPMYLQILSQLRFVDAHSTLNALYKYSTSHVQSRALQQGQGQASANASTATHLRWGNSYGHEETTFYRLAKGVARGTEIRTPKDALEVTRSMVKWMTLYTAAGAAFAADVMGSLQASQSQEQTEMESARAAFVALLLGFCENQLVLKALAQGFAAAPRKSLSDALANFIPSIQMSSSPAVTGRLEQFRTETLAGFDPVDKKKEAENAEIDDILDSTMGLQTVAIPELPISNSRAGLYIYLNAALVGRPLIDDTALYQYLHNRYQGDAQSTVIDLILASFDVLANAVFRNEGQKAAHLLRSYLINKLPLLLASYAANPMYPFDPQFCISDALSRIDTNAFPTLSSMFDDMQSNNTFTDSVRQDFCFACCLHGLLPENSIQSLLGEITYQTLPQGGRYVKQTLVQQCMADTEKIQSLIAELDNMDGNVGAVCQALTEVLSQLCNNKDTITLKSICSQLAGKPLALDVMLLFEKLPSILQPLCQLLDDWKYEEDQDEYQPVYEEFGSVLLLVLAFAKRYSLSPAEMGIKSTDSFVAKLITKGHLSRPLADLSDTGKEHVGGWIRGLFDNDAGGLGDDLMSSCPPQEFYLLIPTLFDQIALAIATNYLSEDHLKGGVEYLLDTFLLPSMVTAVTFLSTSLWLDRPLMQKSIMTILQLVLKQTSSSSEAQAMHSAMLNMVAKPLEYSLRAYLRKDPRCQQVEPLLRDLKENIKLSRRTSAADHNELEAWTSSHSHPGGIVAAVRHIIQGCVHWSLHTGVTLPPTSFTHRQFLAAKKMLGASQLLHVILEEVKSQTEANNGSVVYDIACAFICAPEASADPSTGQQRGSLREALKSKAEEWKKVQKADVAMAETIVRLYRKVEAQMASPDLPNVMPNDMTLNAAGALEGAALDEALANAAAQAPPAEPLNLDVDLGLGGGTGDLGLGSGTNSAGGLDLTDSDMFSGLGPLDGWDIDLS